ncbi:MAG TPA: ABC transporter ATP-binding protein [Anaeromyxobacteraceae bacterium]|nr:ABC transporter ATP-binding protein [Anaeromyxobacteraceae bacterium]
MAAVFDLDRVAVEVGGREALREVSFSVAEGERVVLLGVNGCGKTTLLRLLDGLAFGVRGTVRYRDRLLDAASLDDAAFRRRFRGEVALLFQNVDAMLFNPTVADEIAFGPRQLGLAEPDRRTERWAETFGLTPLLGRPPFELSGGEKKRVALAALLAVGPSVLLLDEATANLDPASSAFLVDLLAGLEGVTTVVATHGLGMAEELGTRAVLLSPDGRGVLFDGPPHDLLHDEALLVRSGLAHRHAHRHGTRAHAHWHVHEGD